jgi:serine/threonine protein kinase/class 3 adenylate cyclase
MTDESTNRARPRPSKVAAHAWDIPPTEAPGPSSDQPTTSLAGNLTFPRPFGRYTLLKQLGRGGMGTVYLAQDTVLGRQVALKVPHPEVVAATAALDRFYREARAIAQIDHPHICRVYDVGHEDNLHYLTLAYIDGEPLSTRLAELAGQPRRCAELVRLVALAMEEAHRLGIIHRDLKPSNLMITSRGEPVVMDFGLARQVSGDGMKTTQGEIMGTPAYMSPEQAIGDVSAMGPGCDVYSLGVILYEMLAGRVPFQGPTTSLLVQIVHDAPPAPSAFRPDVDPVLESICLRAMARQPAHRFTTMQAFADALTDYLQGNTTALPAPPSSPPEKLLDGVLQELRVGGWEQGLERIKRWLPERTEVPEQERAELLDWLEGRKSGEVPSSFAPQPSASCEDSARVGLLRSEAFKGRPQVMTLSAWVRVGATWRALKQYQMERGRQLLEQACALPRPPDRALEGELAYLRAYILARQGRWEDAVVVLHQSLERLGSGHFLTGAVLDTLGRVYAGKCNFRSACDFYHQAILCKQRAGDESGLVLSYEELARVYIEWDHFDEAEEQLNAGLRVAQKLGDRPGEARIMNHLGRNALARGDREAAQGKKTPAKWWWKEAGDYFDCTLQMYQELGMDVPEGRARKYAAMLCLYENDIAGAEEHMRRAEELLHRANHPQGLAELPRFLARVRQAQDRHDEALQLLRQSLARFDELHQPIESTRTQLELARALAHTKSPTRLIVRAYQEALQRAEACRRADLVEQVETELQAVDEETHWRHVFRRVRGHGAPESTSSLNSGTSESLTVLFLDLADFEAFCQGLDPESVLWTLNQLLADLECVLDRYRAQVTGYPGGGFMALLRETSHAERAVHAALDLLAVIDEFNRPRTILGMKLLPARIGVATGVAFLGNIGTYRNLDFTAVGPPVNLAASLMRRADTTSPLISQETWELVRDRFVFRTDSPRQVEVAGVGVRTAWDVAGRSTRGSTGIAGK